MAESRRYAPNQPLDLDQILQEAQHRWLRPTEICEILRNHQNFQFRPDPPVRPPAGSLFLFDRKVLRYFRKDGHSWRKKKDGKTVREAHEKLKAGSVDVLHCYYAHGEDNENFQRRSYWMLDEQLENIVLVHYREVKEGYKLGVSRLANADPKSQLGSSQTNSAPSLGSSQTNSAPSLEQSHSPDTTGQMSYAPSPNAVDWNEQVESLEFEEGDSGEELGTSSLVQSMHGSVSHDTSFNADETTGFLDLSRNCIGSGFPGASFNLASSSSAWADGQGSSRNINTMHEQNFYFEQLSTSDFLSHKFIDTKLDADGAVQGDVRRGDQLILDSRRIFQEHDRDSILPQLQNYSGSQAIVTSAKSENSAQVGGANNDGAGELKKLDSFGRWMDKEIGGDCDDSLVASDSGNYWNTLDTENDDKEVSSLSRHMQLDTDSLGPSLSQEQLFSICDFAPDWAYSGVKTKILITGTFLGGKKHYSGYKWCCMFGEIEVSAEVLTDNVIRCQVPFHASGRVPFYVTCSNRLSCSEVREFEYREKTSGVVYDEVCFLIRLAKLLCSGLDSKWLDCSVVECDKCKVKNDIYSLKRDNENSWGRIEAAHAVFEGNLRDVLIQNLLKDKLYEWLVCKTHEVGKGLHIFDEEGLAVIHLAAALGYAWAMSPISVAGVSPNFRDARGRTALHWASYYGREETVVALLRLGAAPGAVEDPTPAFPGGKTAADLASSRGYKGISGYLAEEDLTSHLSSLSVNDNVMDGAAATIAAEKATEIEAQNVFPSDRASDEELLLKASLAAVRKSAHAAALIQAAFRARSFRHRQLTMSSNDIPEVSLDLVALSSLSKVQKKSHFENYLHSAAIKIQQKYRGWKGRKDFLKIRSRIVKIQAHVRGHQVRKQYKKVVWSVSVVEKAILRWRRKKPGLRGFRIEKTIERAVPEVEKNDEYEFLRIGRNQKITGVKNALARVQSMARHPEARDQYMRLVSKSQNLKVSNAESSLLQQVKSSQKKEEDTPDT